VSSRLTMVFSVVWLTVPFATAWARKSAKK
jgi:hypothetical protein